MSALRMSIFLYWSADAVVLLSCLLTDNLPGKRVVHLFDKFKVANRIASHGGTEVFGKLPERLQLLSHLDTFDVVDYIEQRHGGTCIFHRLLH